ncbi:MAG: AAA family ATPase [Bacteroidota bacterium]
MKKINYPLVYFQLREDAILGILVGTDYQLVDKDLKSLKSQLSAYLQRQYKKQDDYWYMDLIEPRLKVLEIKIRPTYKDDTGSYPTNTILKIPVPVIFGETEQGHYECYLPLLEESFYYYDPKQFKSLVRYIAVDLFNQLSPEQLNRHLLYPPPQLDMVSLKVNDERVFRRSERNYQRQYELLGRLTVRYPYSKSLRKQLNTFPEAAWELEKEVGEVIDKLLNIRANILVVGKHGVGKSSVLQQAIKKVNALSKKEGLDMSFWQLMSQRITASARYLGEWQENVEKLIEELRSANGVLWVVDIIRLLQSGGQGAEDSVAAFLVSFLQQGRLQIIGEVTQQELESMRRLLPGFVEHFQVVQIEELPEQKIQAILRKIAEYATQQLSIDIEPMALNDAYRLLLRYYPYESFPGKAIKFLGKCVSEAQLNEQKKISRQDVLRNFIEQTGMPKLFLRDDILLDQEELTNYFNSSVIGQPNAVDKLCGIVKIFKAGLNNPDKPISTMIFAGPTGVGKTASAKALADYFFGKGQKRNPLIRIDMSEFQHPSQISRFIGAGKEVGKLAQEIRERPFAVVLLDEVEKASTAIFDAFLTVLDEGILVDAFGRVTNFRNTIIVMTSNLGASNRASIGFKNTTSDEAKYLSAISAFFRPEFVNRIDHIVMFNALSREDIEQITLKELDALRQREGFIKRGLKIDFSRSLIDHLADIGFDERYGARPLQRAVEQTVVNPMANWLLLHPEAADQTLSVDFKKGVLVIK